MSIRLLATPCLALALAGAISCNKKSALTDDNVRTVILASGIPALSADGTFLYQGTMRVSGARVSSLATAPGNLSAAVTTSVKVATFLSAAPTGNHLYAVHGELNPPNFIDNYVMDSTTGAATLVQSIQLPDSANSLGVAPRPDGKFVYASICGDSRSYGIRAYSVNASDGLLTEGGAYLRDCYNPLVFDRTGNRLHGIDSYKNKWSAYDSDPVTGELTLLWSIDVPDLPTDIDFSVDGKFAYLGGFGEQNLSVYKLNGTAVPTLVQKFLVSTLSLNPFFKVGSAPKGPAGLTVSRSGKALYVSVPCFATLLTFSIHQTTGEIALLNKLENNLCDHPAGKVIVSPDGVHAYAHADYVDGVDSMLSLQISATDDSLTQLGCLHW